MNNYLILTTIINMNRVSDENLDEIDNDFDLIFPTHGQTYILDYKCNKPISELKFSDSIKHLIIQYHKSLDGIKLPKSLQTIIYSDSYYKRSDASNKSLQNVKIPDTVENITLNCICLFTLDNLTLPKSLKTFIINPWDANPIDGVKFPNSLEKLTIGRKLYKRPENINLPDSLKELTFSPWFDQYLDDIILPKSLKVLISKTHPNNKTYKNKLILPDNLETLTFCPGDAPIKMPSKLKYLTICANYSIPIFELPPNLIKLVFEDTFNMPIDSIKFPDSLQELHFGLKFNQTLKNVILPKSLHTIKFGYDFKFYEDINYPDSITTLIISSLTEPIKYLPMSLKYIKLSAPLQNTINFLSASKIPYGCTIIK